MIDKILNTIIFLCQLAIAFIASFILYLFIAFYDAEHRAVETIGFVVLQPIFGFFISVFSIVGCMVVGLPIRLIKQLKVWWISHFYVAILGVFVGFVMLILSFCFQETVMVELDGGSEIEKLVPNVIFLSVGWFMVIFMMLHTYPPRTLRGLAHHILSFLVGKVKRLLK